MDLGMAQAMVLEMVPDLVLVMGLEMDLDLVLVRGPETVRGSHTNSQHMVQ